MQRLCETQHDLMNRLYTVNMAMPAKLSGLVHPVGASAHRLSPFSHCETHFVAHDHDMVKENCKAENMPSPLANGSATRPCSCFNAAQADCVSSRFAHSARLSVDRQRPLGP